MKKKNYEQVILTFVELQKEDVCLIASSVEAWDVGDKDVYGGIFLD